MKNKEKFWLKFDHSEDTIYSKSFIASIVNIEDNSKFIIGVYKSNKAAIKALCEYGQRFGSKAKNYNFLVERKSIFMEVYCYYA